MSETDLLLRSEAARVLGVSTSTIANMERRGELPTTRTASGVRLYVRRDVTALAEARAAQGHSNDEAA